MADAFERVEEDVFCGGGVEVGLAVVATEGDEVVVAFLLVALEAKRHGSILRYRVRALRECPHLRIEIWGTRFCGDLVRCGPPVPPVHPPPRLPQLIL